MDKKPWQSKTLWVSLIMSVAAFFPPVQVWVGSHSEAFSLGMGGIFAALRLISGGKIVISDEKPAAPVAP